MVGAAVSSSRTRTDTLPDGVKVLATTMKLRPEARERLRESFGPDWVVLDFHDAPDTADVVLSAAHSPQLIHRWTLLFPQAQIIVTEILDNEFGLDGPGRGQHDRTTAPPRCCDGAWSARDKQTPTSRGAGFPRTARRWDIGQGLPPACLVSRETTWTWPAAPHHRRPPVFLRCRRGGCSARPGSTRRAGGSTTANARSGSAAPPSWSTPPPGETRTVYASAARARRNHLGPVRQPPRRRLRAVQPPVPGRRLAAGHDRPGRRQGHPGVGGGASVHVRHRHRALVRAGARAAGQGALPGPSGQAGLPARPAAVVRAGDTVTTTDCARHPAVRRLLRLHRARGLAVARPRTVAPVQHHPATHPRPPLRPHRHRVPPRVRRSPTPRSWSSRPAASSTSTSPSASTDPPAPTDPHPPCRSPPATSRHAIHDTAATGARRRRTPGRRHRLPAALGHPGRRRSRDRTCDHLLVREVLYR